MSEKAKPAEDSFERVAEDAFLMLRHATMRRDEHRVPPEQIRVARALCQSAGLDPDRIIYFGPLYELPGYKNIHDIFQGRICMGWMAFLQHAETAIENLDAAREEESLRLKQHEEAVAAVETAGVGFSNMNNGEDVKFVAIDPSNPNRVTDSLSHSDLAAMVEFLATIFDEGPDGDSAVCRQTGKEFFTVKMGYKGDGKQSPEVIRKWLIRWATLEIVGKAPMVDGGTIYWRKRPIIELERDVLKIYARVAFGP